MSKKDWTGIHFLEKTSYYDGKKSTAADLLWSVISLVCFIMIQVSAFAILFCGLAMDFNLPAVFCLITVLSAIFWALSVRWQFLLGGIGVFCLVLGIIVWRRFDALSQGFLSIYDRAMAMVDAYMSGGSGTVTGQGELTMVLYGFIAAMFCLYGVICYFALKSSLPVLIPGILWILGIFLVGDVPDLWWTAVFCISGCVLVSGSYTRQRFGKYGTLTALGRQFYIRGNVKVFNKIGVRTGVYMFLVLALGAGLAFLFGTAAGLPSKDTLKKYQQQVRDWTKEHLNMSMEWGNGAGDAPPQGGISGGDLASAGDLYYYGDEQIKVTVGEMPESNLYIKGYVGDKYGSNRWFSESGGEYNQFSDVYGLSGEIDIRSMPYTLLSQFGQDHMVIEKQAVFGDFEFFPYGVLDESGSGWINDLYIYGDSASSSFDFTPVLYPLAGDFEDLTAYSQQMLSGNGQLQMMESDYQSFVKSRYTQVPDAARELMAALTGANVPEALEEKLRFVRQLLADTCEYTLTPGALPAGEDFTQYFLTQNRRGYCMHFATAATLMLRTMGVPARYVEGYIMAPGNFSPSQDGYSGIAYDYQAHAWTEIYLDGVGWLPVEMTPGFYDTAALDADMDESDAPETFAPESEGMMEESAADGETSETDGAETAGSAQESQSDADAGQTDGGSDDRDDFGDDGSGGQGTQEASRFQAFHALFTVLLWMALIVAFIAAVIGVIVLRAAALRRKRTAAMRQPDKSRACAAIYQELMRLFEICGYKQANGESMRHYFESVAADHDCVDVDACGKLVALANEAAFSRDGIALEQWQWCRRLYQTIRRGMYHDQKRMKQLKMKFWYVC